MNYELIAFVVWTVMVYHLGYGVAIIDKGGEIVEDHAVDYPFDRGSDATRVTQ